MITRYASLNDLAYLSNNERHISQERLTQKIKDNEVLVAVDNNAIIGYLRFNFFWDHIPFVNLISVEKEHRGKGVGKNLMGYFESEMKAKDYTTVMTSTLADETAQHFYRKLSYKDSGCLLLEGEALEIIFTKKLS